MRPSNPDDFSIDFSRTGSFLPIACKLRADLASGGRERERERERSITSLRALAREREREGGFEEVFVSFPSSLAKDEDDTVR